jgi:tol-pal system protein YbgF
VTARSSSLFLLGCLLAAITASPGCVIDRTGRSTSSGVMRDIEANSAAVGYTRDEVDAERGRIDAIENRAALARRSLAESTATAENLLEAVQEVAGQVQAVRHSLEKSARFNHEVDERLADLEFRLMTIEDKLGIEPDYGDEDEPSGDPAEGEGESEGESEGERSGDPAESETGSETETETGAASASHPTPAIAHASTTPAVAAEDDDEALALLGRALNALQEEKYRQAGSALNEFLDSYPEHPRAGDARNLLGDCLYAMGRYKESISEYEAFIQASPGHPAVPQAMYRQGMAFIELGTESDLDAARIFLDDLIEKFPDSAEAERARRKIEILE